MLLLYTFYWVLISDYCFKGKVFAIIFVEVVNDYQ